MATTNKNIVLIIADDLGLNLGCYGLSNISTPNIDELAASGTKFTHAFASTASCSGSRSTIYTGLYTHENGQYGLEHGYNHFQTLSHVETMPGLFNDLGYLTAIIGKVHVGPYSVYPWQVIEESKSRDVAWNSQRAEAFFERAKEEKRSFHLTVGFRDPHRDDTRGGFGNDEQDVLAEQLKTPDYKVTDVEVPFYITDVPELRAELVEYYKAISRMDIGVGLIVDALKKHGLEEETMLMFVSDNGAPFLNSKTTLYDAGVKLPLIVRCPGSPRNIVNPNLVSFTDILPTCLDFAGSVEENKKAISSNVPRRIGRSFLPVLRSSEILPENVWRQHVFGSHTFHEIQNYWPTRFLRTRRFKYHRNIAWRLDFPFATDLYGSLSWEGIRNMEGPVMIGKRSLEKYLFRGPEELFDLENDPEELRNLASEKEYRDTLLKCRKMVEDWQFRTHDAWLMKDGTSAVVSRRFQTQGLNLVDRFDIDWRNPGNRDGPHWLPTSSRGVVSEIHSKAG